MKKSILSILFFALALQGTLTSYSTKIDVYFSPDDKPEEKLVELINRTNHSIRAAIYYISNRFIVGALKKARARGVKIELVIDNVSLSFTDRMIRSLLESGVTLYLFNPKTLTTDRMPIMHHKFGLFNIDGRNDLWTWTGSFNWTHAGNNLNQENVVLLNDRDVYKRFDMQFEKLKRRCASALTVQSFRKCARGFVDLASLPQLLSDHP